MVTITRIILFIILGNSIHQALSAQEKHHLALSIQGGPNVFFGNAYPSNIIHSSIGGTFTWQPYNWGGLMGKLESGNLGGTNKYEDGQILFSSNVQYQLYGLYGFLDFTNILTSFEPQQRFSLKGFIGTGYLKSNYSFPYINETPPQKYTLGTDNQPEVLFPVIGGFIFEVEIYKRLKAVFEFSGFIEYTDRLDGVAYGSVDKERLIYFDPEIWQLVSYKEEFEITGEHPTPQALNFYDNFLTFEIGLKYYFGHIKSKKSYYKNSKQLPKSYLKYNPMY